VAEFRKSLTAWFPKPLDEKAVDNLLLNLDEYGVGRVSVTMLDEFAGTGSLISKIAAYKLGKVANNTELSQGAHPADNPPPYLETPLLVWVDDRPDNNFGFVHHPRNKHINFIEITSTAEAKVWIDENLGISSMSLLTFRFLVGQ
jgi:hypothetical protein